jgi:cardiolipin synthase A/B
MGFSVDRVAGSVFRGREVLVRPRAKIDVPDGETCIFLEPSDLHLSEDMGEVFAALENEDEVILGFESRPEPLFKGYAVFSVRDGVIDSLPGRARDDLKVAILKAAGAGASAPKPTTAAILSPIAPVTPRTIDALFDRDDLILDGMGHRVALETIVGRARQKVFIHSTFISFDGWNDVLPALLEAAAKGVKVQVFWGQADDAKGSSASRDACEALRAAISSSGDRTTSSCIHLPRDRTPSFWSRTTAREAGWPWWGPAIGSLWTSRASMPPCGCETLQSSGKWLVISPHSQ